MLIIPAIDLKDGRCVRLRQGRAEDATVYGDDPVAMARHWVAEGAEYLHVVDLDGAFYGRPMHAEAVAAITGTVNVPIEVGGGLRTDDDVRRMLDAGVSRAIVGTRALTDPDAVRRLAAVFGPKLAVGIDARDGRVAVKGWVESTEVDAETLARDMQAEGVTTLICTDISSDGMLSGPNVAGLGRICEAVSCDVIASGGIRSAGDIRALAELGKANLAGAIVGKALYEGDVGLKALQRAGAPDVADGGDRV
ncbi:MAG: 1-(5-phosphoribosyl)-5-[(5-phosphoribosylamino)methylideneamino]imidazole-4-carboxamide isomerase [Lentisphaerae bacterium]|nr:1-(5-phosphoribosyl)-5-[(5-phosphoribosylamino)methylideneamino]imidazole-4-carboxamide isomerase [Lentisphaerota bacterium]